MQLVNATSLNRKIRGSGGRDLLSRQAKQRFDPVAERGERLGGVVCLVVF
jgi:hypothetical protein